MSFSSLKKYECREKEVFVCECVKKSGYVVVFRIKNLCFQNTKYSNSKFYIPIKVNSDLISGFCDNDFFQVLGKCTPYTYNRLHNPRKMKKEKMMKRKRNDLDYSIVDKNEVLKNVEWIDKRYEDQKKFKFIQIEVLPMNKEIKYVSGVDIILAWVTPLGVGEEMFVPLYNSAISKSKLKRIDSDEMDVDDDDDDDFIDNKCVIWTCNTSDKKKFGKSRKERYNDLTHRLRRKSRQCFSMGDDPNKVIGDIMKKHDVILDQISILRWKERHPLDDLFIPS